MTYRHRTGLLLLFAGVVATAQDLPGKMLKGKITANDSVSVSGVHIVNLVSEESTFSGRAGVFEILASEDDLLVFSAEHLEYARKSISKKDYENGFFEVKMYVKPIELNEVIIENYSHINAKDLGIINYTPKTYTPAERKLRTAGEFKWYSPLLIPLGGMSVDGLINSISGRTARLKKELNIERRERLQQQLDIYFDTKYYTESLYIPEIYVEGFKYYVVEDEELEAAISAKSKDKMQFRLSALATDFLEFYKDYETKNTD